MEVIFHLRRHRWRIALLCAALCLVVALSAQRDPTGSPDAGEKALQVPGAAFPGTSIGAAQASGGPPPQDDADDDGVPDRIEDELALRFAPIVRLHPDDMYRPANVPWYLPRVRMWYDARWRFDDAILKRGEVTLLSLTAQSNRGESCGLTAARTCFFLEHTDKDGGDSLDDYRRQTRQGTGPSGWTCYAHIRPAPEDHPGMYDLQYIFFYSYNGDIARGPLESGHEADWEHVTVRVEEDLETVHRLYYPAHEGEGRWYDRETSPGARDGYAVAANGRPIVYSAFNSHASYPWAGEWKRKRNFNDFTRDGGPEWDCGLGVANLGEKLRPRGGMEWVQYSGSWGEIGEVGWATGPCGPAYQDWWNGDPPEGVTSATSPLSLNSGGIIIAVAICAIIVAGLVFALGRPVRRRGIRGIHPASP